MDALISQLQDTFEGQIDFEGQKIAELFCTILLSFTGVIAFVIGYIQQDIYLTLWIGLAGTILTMLVVVPPWPAFNEHPEPWLFAKGKQAGVPPGGIVMSGGLGT